MWWTHFLCSSLSSRENRIWSPRFLFVTAWFSLDSSAEITSWTPLVCLLLCLNEFVSWWKVHSYFIMIINQQIVNIRFLKTHVLEQQFLYCFTWSNNQFLILNIVSLFSDFFTDQANFSLFWPLNLLQSTS